MDSELKWCATHDEPLMLYDDGSYSCRLELILGSSLYDCKITEVPAVRELRGAMEEIVRELCWEGFGDGGEVQDILVRRGLLVEVPATPEAQAEWEIDMMYVFPWSKLARARLSDK